MTETKPLIYKKMANILASVDAIKKLRTNTQGTGFKYRGIDDIYNELHSIFAEHGVFCTTNVIDRKQEERVSKSGGNLFYTVCTIEFRFYAEDGSFVSSIVMGEAMDSGDKSTNKAMAIAHKYCLLQAFLIPTEEDKDSDKYSYEIEKREAPKTAFIPQKPYQPLAPAKEKSIQQKTMDAFLELGYKEKDVELVVMKSMKDWNDADIETLRNRYKEVKQTPRGAT